MAKFNRDEVFETPRLRLRVPRAGDEEFLASLDSDPEVMRYIHSGPLARPAALKWAKTQVDMAPHRWHLKKWVAELRDGTGCIGWMELCKFRGVFDPHESRHSDDVNFGYEFAQPYWGQGFATEAARRVLAYAFDELKLDRLLAYVRAENIRSARLLEKLGFRRSAARHYKDEARNECVLYALWANDWMQASGALARR